MFGGTNTKLGSGGPSYGYIMTEYPEGSQCQITRELDEKILKAKSTDGNWAFALPEMISLKVPAEYQEIEYIEATGTQCITLTFTNAVDVMALRYVMDIYVPSSAAYGGILGNTNPQPYFMIPLKNSNDLYPICTSTGGTQSPANNSLFNKRFTYELIGNSNSITVKADDNIWLENSPRNASSRTQLGIFFDVSGNRNYTSGRLYHLTIYGIDHTTKIFDLYPVYYKIDSTIGLYDVVNDTFYTNQGTGTFVAGPAVGDKWIAYCTNGESEAEKKVNILYNGDIKSTVLDYRIPIKYQAIEYLQNSTAAYYDTGIIPTTTNYTTELKFQVAQTNGGYLLGVEGGYRLRKPNGYNQIYYAYIDSETYFTVDGISTVGTDFDLIYNATGGQIILNGAVKATNANIRAKSDRQYSILIGANRYGANVQNYGVWRYKEVIISERDTGNKLVELFPCYRKSDNVIGFWDTVNQRFLTHLGTGTVTAGPDI